MAIVRDITHQPLERDSMHSEVECTYEIIRDMNGNIYLQLDTYGSKGRQMAGKKSQSIRLSQSAIDKLKTIFKQHGL
ncbi:hypothetical protein [Chromobacterium sp. ASV23]|uniref:hypothetical protein n=1 Tax=Chromobacterium sp. ASV23 TaxID=2795110 RepID=UPI0018EB4DA0|nr:hypothetical protein [Chromobacterium sp. ASV23]